MSDKSHVSMEHKVCIVCGTEYQTDAILLDRRLQQSMDRTTVTGWGMCTPCKSMKDQGYIAMIEVKNTGTRRQDMKPEDADRTGTIAHVRASAFANIFDVPAPEGGVCFVDKEVIAKLQELQAQAQAEGEGS